jgi:hypothetical protein
MCIPPDILLLRLILSFAAGDDDAFAFALDDVERCPACGKSHYADTMVRAVHQLVRLLTQHCGDWQPVMAGDLRDYLDLAADAEERWSG